MSSPADGPSPPDRRRLRPSGSGAPPHADAGIVAGAARAPVRLRGSRPRVLLARRLAPEAVEAVEVARLGREHVHDDVEEVDQDPVALAGALDLAGHQAVLLLHPK